ncbi:MAG: ImmA/IrrE family metallo-endopeptidase [Bacteroidetes bacterium]|nr:ImmA/IrrE family metallo-endopeptidase [Bacteroidota bacterium]
MSAFNDKILEARANKFRVDCGIDHDAAIDLFKLLESLNVITAFLPMGENFSGMALKTATEKFMLVNSNQQVGRQNFTIGHELYHLFIQEGFTFEISKKGFFNKKEREEYNADVFSSCFLMPEAGIIQLIPEEELAWGGKISLATIIKLEQYFGVSRRALLWRLDKVGLIKFGDYEAYLSGVKKSATEHGYTTVLYTATNTERVIGDYGVLTKALFDNERISETHYHNLMKDIFVDTDNIEEDEQEE